MNKITAKIFYLFGLANKLRYSRNIKTAISSLPYMSGLTLIDIGAAGDIEPRWKVIQEHLNYIGFEPDNRSRVNLLNKENYCKTYTLYPYAVSDKVGSFDLNLCRNPQVSSSYTPNNQFTELFPDPRRWDVLSIEELESTTLDTLDLKKSDFIKLDIQGNELNALRGGEIMLKDVLGLEIEIEFLPIYHNQPLFGDVSAYLAKYDFEFIDFVNLCRWERDKHNGFGHCVFGDGLFLKSPEYVLSHNLSADKISSYLAILLLYNRFDLIQKTLVALPDHLNADYEKFKKAIEPIKKHHIQARGLNMLINDIRSLLGLRYRLHLIY
ncbi:FkbM family methyltransferase [Chlorobium sp. BLA1]|uniref:FkbM family methyltransferase n=1 Tax=Candidatus Chlorobium masyuteum TaxID=2716876 RepID=UPI00141F6D80|nr:FkbM family methyltransferase [Candidatus Chlorobium masyuteum]NHQ59238.1 FkbM family methyltransferase [Candidatus Chlorobium masyuteum]